MNKKFETNFYKYKMCLRLDKGEKYKDICNELVDLGFYSESLRYKGKNENSVFIILYNFYNSYKRFGIYSICGHKGRISILPKKGSTKKEWERVRQQKRKELLEELSKEDLISIIEDLSDIVNTTNENKKEIYKRIVDKKSKCTRISIEKWCLLLGISKSYFYEMKNASPTPDRRRRADEAEVKDLIEKIFEEHNKVYGAKRIHAILKDDYNLCISYKTVYNYMNQIGIKSVIRRKNKRRVDLKNTKVKCANVLNRNFKNELTNNCICTDVTYIKWNESFIYLSALIDLRNNFIVGWSISMRNDNQLVMDSFKDVNLENYRLVHSDHGYQYCAKWFTTMLDENDVTQSMSRIGNSLDNRPIEYWFSILKEECIKRCDINIYSYEEVKQLISEFIKEYNYNRIQLCLNNLSPNDYMEKVLNI